MNSSSKYAIIKFNSETKLIEEDTIIVEYTLNLFLNGNEFISFLCTPDALESMVVGFLFSEGIIHTTKDIADIRVDMSKGEASVKTKNNDQYYIEGDKFFGKRAISTACGNQKTICYPILDFLGRKSDRLEKKIDIYPDKVLQLVNLFNKKSGLFIETGGVHSCALGNQNEILLFREDIGRHNALDKILGEALVNEMLLEDKIIITSGRITEEMVKKVVKAKIPILISRSAPTDKAIDMARRFHLTLIGFARGNRMNVYANNECFI